MSLRVQQVARGRLTPAVLLLAATLALAGLVLAGDIHALALAPALSLALLLRLRRYPGERVLAGLRRLAAPRRGRARAALLPRGRMPFARMARGGLLIGRSLAVRPPPGLAA